MKKLVYLGAAVTCGCAAQCARASIVHFLNPAQGQPGHYEWDWQPVHGRASWLDITSPAWGQSNTMNDRSVAQLALLPGWSPADNMTPIGGAHVMVTVSPPQNPWTFPLPDGWVIGPHSEYYPESWHAYGPVGESQFPEAVLQYIGVLTGDGNYGWIEVVRHGMVFTASAWAYETEPGASIQAGQVPAPASVSVLGLGALAAMRKKRT